MIIESIGVILIFGCAAFCGIILATFACAKFEGFADGPQSRPIHPALLIGGAMVLGLVLALKGTPTIQLGLTALLCVPLAAIWFSDAAKGVVPDWFTLGPLAIVALYVITHHAWWVALSAIVPFVPFALAASVSKGRGMGWGDAKFVALGGAIIGMQSSLLVFALACFVATVASVIRDRGKTPVAFAPYLVASVAVAIALQVHL